MLSESDRHGRIKQTRKNQTRMAEQMNCTLRLSQKAPYVPERETHLQQQRQQQQQNPSDLHDDVEQLEAVVDMSPGEPSGPGDFPRVSRQIWLIVLSLFKLYPLTVILNKCSASPDSRTLIDILVDSSAVFAFDYCGCAVRVKDGSHAGDRYPCPVLDHSGDCC